MLLGMKTDTLNGQLDPLILATLADAPAHGYAILQRLKQRSRGAFDLAEGTIYPALHRLERDGLLSSAWSSDSGRRRRVYRLTIAGRGALRTRRSEWRRFAQAVEAVMGGATLDAVPRRAAAQ
jgi:PadR family transcriptional regulator PadR